MLVVRWSCCQLCVRVRLCKCLVIEVNGTEVRDRERECVSCAQAAHALAENLRAELEALNGRQTEAARHAEQLKMLQEQLAGDVRAHNAHASMPYSAL